MNVLSFEIRVRVAAALVEGNSLAATARLVGVQPNTVMAFGVTAGAACARFHDARVRDVHAHVIQIDEIWAFVQKKQKRVAEDDPAEFGDAYTFIALDANSKLVLAYLTDKRTGDAATRFLCDLRARIVGRPQISSDGFQAYINAMETAFGLDVHYAQIVKEFETDSAKLDAAHRYSPGRVIAVETTVITGHPIDDDVNTSFVERKNLDVRMSCRRLTRLTNAFSKKAANLRAALHLHFAYYNWCRVHETLRVTPAMQAGLTDHVWSIAELLRAALATPETPPGAPPAPAPPGAATAHGAGVTAAVRPAFRVIQGGRS